MQELEALVEPRDRNGLVLIASDRRIINFSLTTVMEMGIARWGLSLPLNHQLVIVENVEVMITFHRKQENLLDSDPVCYPSPLSHIGSRELHIVNNFSEVRASIWSDQIATRILIWSVLGRRFGCDDDWNIEADSFASTSGMIHVHTF